MDKIDFRISGNQVTCWTKECLSFRFGFVEPWLIVKQPSSPVEGLQCLRGCLAVSAVDGNQSSRCFYSTQRSSKTNYISNVPTIDDSKFQLLAPKLIIVQLNNIKQDLSCFTFWINWKNLFKAFLQHLMISSFHPSGMTLKIRVWGMLTTRTHANDSHESYEVPTAISWMYIELNWS